MRIVALLLLLGFVSEAQEKKLDALYESLAAAGRQFNIPLLDLGYRENLAAVQSAEQLLIQQKHFGNLEKQFHALDTTGWPAESRIKSRAVAFELALHRERIRLGKAFNDSGRFVPAAGLYKMPQGREWYRYFLRRFTGLDVTPEEILSMGHNQVAKVRSATKESYRRLGWPDSGDMRALHSADQYFYSKDSIRFHFHRTDSLVRRNLASLFSITALPPVEAVEWQGAGAFTPPGIYLGKQNSAYGVDVFMYNFYGGRFPKRCLDWLYLHEAIPGHHLHSRYLQEGFYFGTSEGWACYVEKLGDRLGLYSDPFRRLGEQEWDLVRSVRLVLDVGIHYLGWDEQRCLEYWNQNVPGQGSIARREIRRVTDWPAQAVCYKAGALAVSKVAERITSAGKSLPEAHTLVLEHSNYPLAALVEFYTGSNVQNQPPSGH